MHKRNLIVLVIILALGAGFMLALRALLFPEQGWFGVPGIGMIAVVLMVVNRKFLHPLSPLLTQKAVGMSVVLTILLSIGFILLFGGLAAS